MSRDVYRFSSDEFQGFGIQIWWKLIIRRCGDGEREERSTQRESKDVHRGRASHVCTAQVDQSEGGRTAIYPFVVLPSINRQLNSILRRSVSIEVKKLTELYFELFGNFFNIPPVICRKRIYQFVFFSQKRGPTTLGQRDATIDKLAQYQAIKTCFPEKLEKVWATTSSADPDIQGDVNGAAAC